MLEVSRISVRHGARMIFSDLSLQLPRGRVVGLCGPSGGGKTTLGRVMAGLQPVTGGEVLENSKPLRSADPARAQYLHQNPIVAMNPRWRIGRVLAEGGAIDHSLLAALSLNPALLHRYPHELSGGELQRVSLLRGLATGARFLIADEITAPLDPLIQARLWRVLLELVAGRGIGVLAISHDRALLGHVADRILHLTGSGIAAA